MESEKMRIDVSYESIIRVFMVSFAILFLVYIKDVLFVVFIAVILALIMEPSVDRMQRQFRIPRVFGTGLLFTALIAILGIVLYLITPPLAREIGQMSVSLPSYFENVDFKYLIDNGHAMGLNSSDIQDILLQLSVALTNTAAFLISGTLGFVGGIVSAIMIAVISFYLVLEDNGIEKFVRASLPLELQERCMRIVKKIENKLSRWFVGQIALGFIIGLLSYIGLTIIGVPYALVLALIAGALELIPYIGPILSAIPAIIVGATVSPAMAMMVFVLYFLIQESENYLIVPKVMEKSVGLHPVIIIIAATIGGNLAGIAGMILAVPVATMFAIVWKDIQNEKSKDC